MTIGGKWQDRLVVVHDSPQHKALWSRCGREKNQTNPTYQENFVLYYFYFGVHEKNEKSNWFPRENY